MQFDVFIEPRGKGRPRFTKRGFTYKDSKTEDAERAIRLAYAESYGTCFTKGEPLSLFVEATFPVPKSYSKEKQQAIQQGFLRPTKKPDGDNILKLVADALNGVAYYDDAQIVDMSVLKVYGDTPKLRIILNVI